MHRSIAGYNPYNLFILTIDYSKNFTTNKVLTIGHMSMFVVKSIVIQINGLAYGSINLGSSDSETDEARNTGLPLSCLTHILNREAEFNLSGVQYPQ